jgi:hypothetical protein
MDSRLHGNDDGRDGNDEGKMGMRRRAGHDGTRAGMTNHLRHSREAQRVNTPLVIPERLKEPRRGTRLHHRCFRESGSGSQESGIKENSMHGPSIIILGLSQIIS